MGVQLVVRHDPGTAADWAAVRDRLVSVGEAVVLRMTDGMPAFPDETPDTTWRELRLGLSGGMVTLRRDPGALTCVTWGNADAALLLSRDRLAWACAAATGGVVHLDDGTALPADQFAARLGG